MSEKQPMGHDIKYRRSRTFCWQVASKNYWQLRTPHSTLVRVWSMKTRKKQETKLKWECEKNKTETKLKRECIRDKTEKRSRAYVGLGEDDRKSVRCGLMLTSKSARCCGAVAAMFFVARFTTNRALNPKNEVSVLDTETKTHKDSARPTINDCCQRLILSSNVLRIHMPYCTVAIFVRWNRFDFGYWRCLQAFLLESWRLASILVSIERHSTNPVWPFRASDRFAWAKVCFHFLPSKTYPTFPWTIFSFSVPLLWTIS